MSKKASADSRGLNVVSTKDTHKRARPSDDVVDRSPLGTYVSKWKGSVFDTVLDWLKTEAFMGVGGVQGIIFEYFWDNHSNQYFCLAGITRLEKRITEDKHAVQKLNVDISCSDLYIKDLISAINNVPSCLSVQGSREFKQHSASHLTDIVAAVDRMKSKRDALARIIAQDQQGLDTIHNILTLFRFTNINAGEMAFFASKWGDVLFSDMYVDFVVRVHTLDDVKKTFIWTLRKCPDPKAMPVFEIESSIGEDTIHTGLVQYKPGMENESFRRRIRSAECSFTDEFPRFQQRLNSPDHNRLPFDQVLALAMGYPSGVKSDWSRDLLYLENSHLTPNQLLLVFVMNAAGWYSSRFGPDVFVEACSSHHRAADFWKSKASKMESNAHSSSAATALALAADDEEEEEEVEDDLFSDAELVSD